MRTPIKTVLNFCCKKNFNRLFDRVLTRPTDKGKLAATHDKQGGRGRCILPD